MKYKEDNERKEAYYALVNKIERLGTRRRKRHGEYVRLNVYDDYCIELDTWSKAVDVYKGDLHHDHLGIDFGGFKCNIVMVKFWSAHILN